MEPKILLPFDRREAIPLTLAAEIAGRDRETARLWCIRHGIGRLVGGRWAVSRVALLMYLDGERAALLAYHRGDRTSAVVRSYYERAGVPLPVGGIAHV